MKINRVGYGATLNTGNYENVKLYLEAEVEEWEDPIKCIEVLKQKLLETVRRKEEATDYEERVERARRRISNINYKLGKAKHTWQEIIDAKEKAINLLDTFGVAEEKLSMIKHHFPDTPSFDPVKVDNDDNDNEYGVDVDDILL